MAKRRKNRKSGYGFEGLAPLQKKLKQLPDDLRKNAAREATRTGVDIVLHEARNNLHRAPHDYRVTLANGQTITRKPGQLAQVMTMQRVKPSAAPVYLSMHKTVFLRHPLHGIGNIAHFLEYGVSPHQIERVGGTASYTHPGHEARPFLRPAVRKKKPLVYREMKRILHDGIVKELGQS